VAGPEPSKLMARVQIPAGTYATALRLALFGRLQGENKMPKKAHCPVVSVPPRRCIAISNSDRLNIEKSADCVEVAF